MSVPVPAMFDESDFPVSARSGMPAPDRDLDRTISHVLTTAQVNAGHLQRHVDAAQAATTPDSLAHNLQHASRHAAVVTEHQVKLRDALVRRVPAIGQELGQLDQSVAAGTRKSGGDLDRGLAHDISSAIIATGHVSRHLDEAKATGDPASVKFNLQHAATHVKEIQHYHRELHAAVAQRLPGAGAEMGLLYAAAHPVKPVPPSPRSAARAEGPGDYGFPDDGGPQPY